MQEPTHGGDVLDGRRVRVVGRDDHARRPSPEHATHDETVAELRAALDALRHSEADARERAERLRHEHERTVALLARCRDAFDHAPEPLLLTDARGLISEANHAAGALLGVEPAGLRNAPLLAFVADDERDAFTQRLRALAPGERVTGWATCLRLRRGDGLPAELAAARGDDEAGGPNLVRWALRARPRPEPAPSPTDDATLPIAPPRPVRQRGAAPRVRWSADELQRVLLGAGTTGFADALRTGIGAGLHLGYLRAGDRLPSIREAAAGAGVDHRVVATAYRRLAGEGVVVIRNRHGVTVAGPPPADLPELNETAEWLAGVLEQSAEHQVKVAQLPDLLRRWTTTAAVRCACVESAADERVALCHELRSQWGLDTHDVALERAGGRAALVDALRGADLAVTTAYHAAPVAAAAQALGIPCVVVGMNPEVARAAEERLRAGELTAVVADAEYGRRLRGLAGGSRLRVVAADDAKAVAALDPAVPVLLTRAAQLRTTATLRLLVPPSRFLDPAVAADVARVLLARNVEAERRAG